MHNAIRLTLGASLITLSAGLIPAAAQAQMAKSEVKYPYPAEVVTGFVKACSASATKLPPAVAQEICGCMMTRFQNQYSMAEFQKIGQALEAGKPMPKEMEQVTESCVEQTLQLLKKK
jgi:hypothetical protein